MATTIHTYTGATSRRGLVRYASNPFVEQTNSIQGIKRISSTSDETRVMVINADGQTIKSAANFVEHHPVDRTQFIKLYINGVKALRDLSQAGAKIFELLYLAMADKPNEDKVVIHFSMVNQNASPMSRATFTRGMNELLDKQFLAEAIVPNTYYINIDYMFNGDRLTFIKSFYIKDRNSKRDPNTIDIFEGKTDKEMTL